MKNKLGVFLFALVVAFGALVLYNIHDGRDLNLAQNTETILVTMVYEGPLALENQSLEGRSVYKSGIESEGRVVLVEKKGDSYRINARIVVTRSGPYMKHGSQPVKMGRPFILEGEDFYLEGYLSFIEAGVDDEE